MHFSEDIWIELKTFLFHRNLWNIPKYKRLSVALRELPRYDYSYPSVFNYIPQSTVCSSSKLDKFIKKYECFQWVALNKKNILHLVTFIYIPKAVEPDIFVLDSLKYDIYIK